jgi:peptidoglycan/xylan/chitin deacetylase (PgdA/CDA1 family)
MHSRLRRIPVTTLVVLVLAAAAIYLSSCGRGGGSSTQSSPASPPPPAKSEARHLAPTQPQAEDRSNEVEVPPEPEVAAPVERTVPAAASRPAHHHKQATAQSTGVTARLDTELRQGREGSGKVALTFDAGASSKPTPSLLDVLHKNGVKATFFLTGKWVEQNPGLVKRIAADGHEIGNHTYSHPDLRRLSDDEIGDQLSRTESLVQQAAGVGTKPYFRPPFGARDERVLRVAAEDGYQCVYWTVDSWDAFKKGIQASEIDQRVLDRASGGSIVLMHCGSWPTVQALPEIIATLRARGYELVTVSELQKAGS